MLWQQLPAGTIQRESRLGLGLSALSAGDKAPQFQRGLVVQKVQDVDKVVEIDAHHGSAASSQSTPPQQAW